MMRRMLFLFLLVIVGFSNAFGQETDFKGIVLSEDNNEPIAGALVTVSGTTVGAITDMDGRFSIHNSEKLKNAKLDISFLGYKTAQVKAAAFSNVTLQVDNMMLGDVVVVAYGKSSKASLTGSAAQVNAESIKRNSLNSPIESLAGASAGVQVLTNSGDISHNGISIQVRGIGSMYGSTSPVVVLDGVIMEGNDSYSDINPDDVASITVLKDASATSLYGNRASNGVVLITTKAGRSNTLSVEANMKYGTYTRGTSEYSKMGVNDWMRSRWQAQKRSYIVDANMSDAEAAAKTSSEMMGLLGQNIFDSDNVFDNNGNVTAGIRSGYTDTDWMDAITRTGVRQEYGVNANAMTEKYDFYASMGYLSQQGYIKNTDSNRTNARIKANFTPNNWFKAGINLSGNIADGSYLDFDESSYTTTRNPFVTLERMAPIYSYYEHDKDGNIVLDSNNNPTYSLNESYLSNRNLIYELYNNSFELKRTTLLGDAYATISFLKDFSFTMRGNVVSLRNDRRIYKNSVSGEYAASASSNGGELTRTFTSRMQNRYIQELNWSHQYGVHNIDAFLAHEAYKMHYTSDVMQKGNQKMSTVFPEISNFNEMVNMSGSEDQYTTESYLMRGRYNYDNKYFFNASYRRDGSSRFYNPWGNFWSVGGAWIVSNESFMKDITSINSLKFRASYGVTGNDEINGTYADYYPYQALYAAGSYNGYGAYTVGQNMNKDLTWEKNKMFDAAIEARLFDRVNVTIEYYHRLTDDLLFPVQNPLSSGATDIYYAAGNPTAGLSIVNRNIGSVVNKGFEFAADVDVIDNKDWKWNVGMNFTLPKNEVKKLPDHKDIISSYYCFSEGRSMYDFYMYRWAGVDMANGRGLFKSNEEMATEDNINKGNVIKTDDGNYYAYNVNYASKEYCGSSQPKIYGSINTNISWRNFNLSMLGTWSLGGKIYDAQYYYLTQLDSKIYTAMHTDLLGAWEKAPEGITEDYLGAGRVDADAVPRMDSSSEGSFFASAGTSPASSRELVSASYFMMRNISLQYTLPQSIASALTLKGASLTASVENAFTITARKGLNPQYSFSGNQGMGYAPARVFSIAANIKF